MFVSVVRCLYFNHSSRFCRTICGPVFRRVSVIYCKFDIWNPRTKSVGSFSTLRSQHPRRERSEFRETFQDVTCLLLAEPFFRLKFLIYANETCFLERGHPSGRGLRVVRSPARTAEKLFRFRPPIGMPLDFRDSLTAR